MAAVCPSLPFPALVPPSGGTYTLSAAEAALIERLRPPPGTAPADYPDVVRQFERWYLATALAAQHGHVTRTARTLGLGRRSLQARLARLGLEARHFRDRRGSRRDPSP